MLCSLVDRYSISEKLATCIPDKGAASSQNVGVIYRAIQYHVYKHHEINTHCQENLNNHIISYHIYIYIYIYEVRSRSMFILKIVCNNLIHISTTRPLLPCFCPVCVPHLGNCRNSSVVSPYR